MCETTTYKENKEGSNSVMKHLGNEFVKAVKESYNERCKELESYLEKNKDWDIIMMYWFCLDAVQHVFFRNKLKIMNFYMMFNEYVGKLSKNQPCLIATVQQIH